MTTVNHSLEEYSLRKSKGLDSQMEISKQIEMTIENEKIMKSNNDRDNRLLKAKQDKLI